MAQSRFLNRQSLHLYPDPARVVVRPFKPATEPRDLNPTDRTRANHIVDRVTGLEAGAAARQLADVLENFAGRHRNLLAIFEARAAEMEDVLESHTILNTTQRRLIGAYFLHEYSFEPDYPAPSRSLRTLRGRGFARAATDASRPSMAGRSNRRL